MTASKLQAALLGDAVRARTVLVRLLRGAEPLGHALATTWDCDGGEPARARTHTR